jgi:Domain of unknown function (DUF4041)/Meiotically up-regulated gene 113
MTSERYLFNPPPGWVLPERDWVPPEGWTPDPSWPPAPMGWVFWIASNAPTSAPAPPPAPPPSAPPPPPTAPAVSAPAPTPVPFADPIDSPHQDAESSPSQQVFSHETSGAGSEREALRSQVAALEAEVDRLLSERAGSDLGSDVVDLDDERVLQEVGIYRYHHPLENAAAYRERLTALDERIKDMVKRGEAVLASEMFTFNNSLAKGRKMTGEFSKLMLRAYNAEADNCVRALRAGNVITAKKRLDASVTAIAKLGSMMEMRVNPDYHQLRFEELELTADYLMKVQEEKEAAREERERIREERKAELELAAERERLTKERSHYVNALEALKASGDEGAVAEVAEKLEAIDQAIEHNDYRAANIRAGYVYVISNMGALGPNMVKIGMTRRLEPMDRVRELGDASVPFPFDVHALFFSEDAVTLESELHQAFAAYRVNRVNERREFFFATPTQVREVLTEKVGNLLEFADEPEATQYLQSKGYWPDSITS